MTKMYVNNNNTCLSPCRIPHYTSTLHSPHHQRHSPSHHCCGPSVRGARLHHRSGDPGSCGVLLDLLLPLLHVHVLLLQIVRWQEGRQRPAAQPQLPARPRPHPIQETIQPTPGTRADPLASTHHGKLESRGPLPGEKFCPPHPKL